jgi:hypothetical protein
MLALGCSWLAAGCGGSSEGDTSESTATAGQGPSSIWFGFEIGQSWQWQLAGEIDTNLDADVFDFDPFDATDEDLAALEARDAFLICYVSVGTFEEWRPDAGDFPEEVLGNRYDEYPDERWLDIRRVDLLAPVFEARFDLCKERGFHGIEADNVDGWDNDTGFEISRADQVAFLRWIAAAAHSRGLAVGLKNVPELIAEMEPLFDFLVTEDCFADGWCGQAAPFLDAEKPVFAAEYTDTGIDFEAACEEAAELGISMILKDRDLDAWREGC